MKDKQKIILDYIKNNKSQRETGISRDTRRKYIREYEERLRQADENLTETEKIDLIDEITQKPKYKSSPRSKTAVTEEVIERIKYYLKRMKINDYQGFLSSR